jgi:hypothetical protein
MVLVKRWEVMESQRRQRSVKNMPSRTPTREIEPSNPLIVKYYLLNTNVNGGLFCYCCLPFRERVVFRLRR